MKPMSAHLKGKKPSDEIDKTIKEFIPIAYNVAKKLSNYYRVDYQFCLSYSMQSLWLLALVLEKDRAFNVRSFMYKSVYQRTQSYVKNERFRLRTINTRPFSCLEKDEKIDFGSPLPSKEHKLDPCTSLRLCG